jgi:hypothetical protein
MTAYGAKTSSDTQPRIVDSPPNPVVCTVQAIGPFALKLLLMTTAANCRVAGKRRLS